MPDFPDWTAGVTLVQGGAVVMAAADFPDWTDGVTVVDQTFAPGADFPDWTKITSQVPGIVPPSPSGSSIMAWYDATKITGLADGQTVTTWADESGNAYDVGPGGQPVQPVYRRFGINNLPCVFWDGTNAAALRSSATPTWPNPMTVAGVYQFNPTAQWNKPAGSAGIMGDNAQYWGVGCPTTSRFEGYFAGGNYGMAPPSIANPHDFVFLAGSVPALYVDGVLQTTTTGTGPTPLGTTSAVFVGGASFGQMSGLIGELLVYNTALTSAQAGDIHSYFAAKWGT